MRVYLLLLYLLPAHVFSLHSDTLHLINFIHILCSHLLLISECVFCLAVSVLPLLFFLSLWISCFCSWTQTFKFLCDPLFNEYPLPAHESSSLFGFTVSLWFLLNDKAEQGESFDFLQSRDFYQSAESCSLYVQWSRCNFLHVLVNAMKSSPRCQE